MDKEIPEFREVRKVLVIKLRHIGDVLLTVPAIRALKESFPKAAVSVLVNKGTEYVLTENPLIDEVIPFERKIKDLPAVKRISMEIGFLRRLRAEGFDMTVDLTGGDRAAVISLVSGARQRLGWKQEKGFIGKKYFYTHTAEPEGHRHTVLQNLDIVNRFGIGSEDISVDFYSSDDDRTAVMEMLKKGNIGKDNLLVHIHPTSRWLFKCWKDEYMAEIIDWLIEKEINVVITSSPDKKEIEKAEKILSLCALPESRNLSRLLNLCGKTSIKQLGALSEISDLFFGVDSAPMHIAAAVNTPVVALFGPSGAFNWGPWDNESSEFRVKSLEFRNPYTNKNGLQSFGKHTVIQKSDECIPCGKDGCDGSKKSRCLDEITPGEVIEILETKLNEIKN